MSNLTFSCSKEMLEGSQVNNALSRYASPESFRLASPDRSGPWQGLQSDWVTYRPSASGGVGICKGARARRVQHRRFQWKLAHHQHRPTIETPASLACRIGPLRQRAKMAMIATTWLSELLMNWLDGMAITLVPSS